MNIEFKKFVGNEISPHINDLAKLRITVFREFPYLYEGSFDYERDYLRTYQNSKGSLIVLAFLDEQVIGATTCIPMVDESDEFYKSFLDRNIDINKVFYFGESIILKEYRGNKIGHKFFEFRETYAQEQIKNLEYTTFCAVDRSNDHPLKPSNYRPLDNFWKRMGYLKQDEMKVFYPWKDIDKDSEDIKSMTIWVKKWR